MEKLLFGVVGCGGIANCCHFPGYEKMDNVKIAAVCDIIEERALKAAERFGLPADKAYTDYKKMIENEKLDAVDICTPNYLHSVIAVFALEHGLNVFCEKPDAVGVEECEKMKKAAEKSGKVLMVMRNNRYRETSKFLKKYIEDGKMGEIYAAHCGWIRRRGIPGKGGWFTTKEQSGGGPLIDLGVHMIDLAIWLMGNPTPVSVTGCTYSKFSDNDAGADSEHSKFGDSKADGIFDVEDLAMGFIRFDNGACLTIDFSWATNIEREKHFVELRGTKAGSWFEDEDKFKIFI
ncbi:MAG: Gfo/Idh/MocA family oxidoreductase [Clostridia bacterium]|nr:Gfo/Idh/MocA family oxidoreductase [Clostridia bacterium]